MNAEEMLEYDAGKDVIEDAQNIDRNKQHIS